MRKHLPSIVVMLIIAKRYFIIRAWLAKLAFRLVFGRMFIFRDAPTWVVRETAKMDIVDESDEMTAMVQQARNEMYARVRTKRF